MDALEGTFDVVIIGSGPAGLAASSEALRANKKVLVIDAGETLSQLYASTQFDKRYFGHPTGGLGGAARLWGAQSGFLDSLSLEKWSELVGCKEDFWNSLDLARLQMNEFLDIKVHHDNLYNVTKETDLRVFVSQFGFNLRHTVYPKNPSILWHWQKFLNHQNFQLILGERLIKIQKNYILSFESGKTLPLGRAKLVIAAGTLATTEIISRSYPEESLRFAIGKNLQDHPCGIVASYSGKGKIRLAKGQVLRSKYGLLKRKYEYRTNNVCGVVEFHYDLDSDEPLIKEKISSIVNKLSQRVLKRIVVVPPKLNVWIQIEQSTGNELSLDSKTDKLISSWRCSESDIKVFEEIFTAAHRMLVSEGFDLIDAPNFSSFEPNQAFHPSGTISMNTNPNLGFVNEFGLMHKNEQILIASAAIFPTPGWVNPTFLIMSLSTLGTKKLLDIN